MDLNTAKMELRYPPSVRWSPLMWETLVGLALAAFVFWLTLS